MRPRLSPLEGSQLIATTLLMWQVYFFFSVLYLLSAVAFSEAKQFKTIQMRKKRKWELYASNGFAYHPGERHPNSVSSAPWGNRFRGLQITYWFWSSSTEQSPTPFVASLFYMPREELVTALKNVKDTEPIYKKTKMPPCDGFGILNRAKAPNKCISLSSIDRSCKAIHLPCRCCRT